MQNARSWRHWGIGAAVVLVLAAAVAVPAIATSPWHATRHSTSARPPALAERALPAQARTRWTATTTSTAGRLATDRTVLTSSAHEVDGRDPRTGDVRWRYRRSNARLCGTTVDTTTKTPVVIAIFGQGGSCDDVSAFDADTGARQWYFNAELPGRISLLDGGGMYYALGDDQVTAFYGTGGERAWSFHRDGCRLTNGAAGTVGLVLTTVCAGRTDLVLLDGYSGKQRWDTLAPGRDPRVLSADTAVVVSASVAGERQLSVLGTDSRVLGTVTERGTGLRAGAAAPVVVGSDWIGYDGSRVLVVDLTRGRLRWSVPATGPATALGDTVVVPERAGLASYTLQGRTRTTTAVGSMAATVDGLSRLGGFALIRAGGALRLVG